MKVTIAEDKVEMLRCPVCLEHRIPKWVGTCVPCIDSFKRFVTDRNPTEVVAWAAKRARYFERRRAKAEKRAPVYCSATSAHGVQCRRLVRVGADVCGPHARRQAEREGRA